MELSLLQLVEYSYNSVFPQIEPIFFPNVLALVGNYHSHDDLYRMLVSTVPDLVSISDKKASLKERVADNVSRIDSLNIDYNKQTSALLAEYQRQLAALTAEKEHQCAALSAMCYELGAGKRTRLGMISDLT